MSRRENNRGGAIVKLVVWSLVLVCLVSVFAVFMVFGSDGFIGFDWNFSILSGFTYPDADEYIVGNVSYSEEIEGIDIEWTAGEVIIKVHDRDEIIVEEDGKIEKDHDIMRTRVVNGVLYIKYAASGVRVFSKSCPAKSLTVTVPQKYAAAFCDIKVDAVSASVSVEPGFVLNELDINGVSGKIAADIEAGKAEIDTVSGNTTIRGKVSEIDISGVSGKVDMELKNAPREIDIETVSGNITLILPMTASFRARLESASGEMSVDSLNVGKGYTHGSGAWEYDFDTVSGGVDIIME